jgi:hypothetical protein
MGCVSRRHFLAGGLGAVAGMTMLAACSRTNQPPASGSSGKLGEVDWKRGSASGQSGSSSG